MRLNAARKALSESSPGSPTFSIPVARTFALDDWREALAVSLSGKAGGKLVRLPGGGAKSSRS